ncbi:MAG: DUF4293 family protein [Bacteroidota bacterium]|nr:DUF4293 family protein [Bacteroidota bacterium]MEC8090269.1 DUF4293 family protein [Bacteroidota bacterium]
MIQRIQSFYLLFVFLMQLAAFFFLPERLIYNGETVFVHRSYIFLITNLLLVVAPFWNIFLYRTRKKQFIVNRVLLLIAMGLLINQCVGYFNAEVTSTNQLLTCVLCMLTVVFLSLANKSIKRDEDLVRSADRLR